MRVLIVCGALLLALFGTCSAQAIDDTINIDDLEDTLAANVEEPQPLVSGDGPIQIGGTTEDDEEQASGDPAENGIEPDMTFTTLSSRTTSNNRIPEDPMRPKATPSNNALGPIYNEENGRSSNNALNGLAKADEPDKEQQNFFEMMFGNPAILAGMVGAVVLILLTVVLVFLFVIYRIKKKDEGSYSLDEPHKVKDPTAYWKDTKEFYA